MEVSWHRLVSIRFLVLMSTTIVEGDRRRASRDTLRLLNWYLQLFADVMSPITFLLSYSSRIPVSGQNLSKLSSRISTTSCRAHLLMSRWPMRPLPSNSMIFIRAFTLYLIYIKRLPPILFSIPIYIDLYWNQIWFADYGRIASRFINVFFVYSTSMNY